MIRITLLLCALAGAVAACGDNDGSAPKDAAPADTPADTGPQPVGPCLDRPTDLPRPPTGALPCELLPPGFAPPG